MCGKMKVLLDDTAVSARAVYQPGCNANTYAWRLYINGESESISGAAVCQQRSANQTSCGTASPTKTCVEKIAQLYINHEPQPKSPFGQPCRPELYINGDQQSESLSGAAEYQLRSENKSESTSGRHSRVDQSGISAAISKVKAYMSLLYINNTVY